MALRIVFLGTPDFAVPTLSALLVSPHDVVAVYCQPPRSAGRGMALRPSPVQRFAESKALPVFTPASLKPAEAVATFAAHKADVAVVVAYGLLLPPVILAAPKHGCLNLHPSKLPRWRGAAPIQRTLMAGDAETAICVMGMEVGLDTGPVKLSEAVSIPLSMTAGELHDIAATRGAALMVRALAELEAGRLPSTPQSVEGVTYATKIGKDELRIDWRRPALEVHDHVRGLSPFPGAWFEWSGERIKVLRTELIEGHAKPGQVLGDNLEVACNEGALRLVLLQRPGRKPMPAAELLRGLTLPQGTQLG
jgi:methionyl-tRNA formyltransferase